MARTGNFGGFAFDEEVFTGMMQEADYWTTPIIASGIVQQDSSIMDLIGEHGNVQQFQFINRLTQMKAVWKH